MTPLQTVIIIAVVVVVLAAIALAWASYRRRRSLQERFGPEYDRIVSERDSRGEAERELRDREHRHSQLELRPLESESRQWYAAAWSDVQARFVDTPNQAVGEADELVTRLASEQGYPTEEFEDQIATLSVEHASTLGHYRAAHEISLKNSRGEATTEELRQALVHYRSLFADLLGEDPVSAAESTPRTDAAHDAGR